LRTAVAFAAVLAMTGMATAFAQPSGGFGGVGGGGPRPTGGSNWGYNRAGTASSGGFAYGDAPRREPSVSVVTPGAGGPCNVPPVTVNNALYYKCGDRWYTAALTSTGIGYAQVAPPPGQ
jgi:hypothetical protein